MITFDQLQNATQQDLASNPELQKVWDNLYFGKEQAGQGKVNDLISGYQSGYHDFNKHKQYLLDQVGTVGSQLASNVDRYTNWNGVAETQNQANTQRQQALDALKARQTGYSNIGLDVSGTPTYQGFAAQLGATPGAGTTAQQTAGQVASQNNPQNQLYQTEYDRIKAQYPNDPATALQVFKAANPNVPADILAQINTSAQPQPQLPDSTNKVLDEAEKQAVNTPNKGDISAAQFADWTAIFHSNNDPYFQQLNAQSQKDLQTGLTQIGQDLATSERKLATDYGQSLATTQANAASRGLTNSSIRNTQEKTLAQTTQDAIEAGRQKAERAALELGTNAERKMGSTNLGNLSPFNINNAPTIQTGQPGLLGFNPGAGTRSLYNPIGNTIGTNQRDQAAAQEDYLNKQSANYRSLNPMG
jgi:hypothetical protein